MIRSFSSDKSGAIRSGLTPDEWKLALENPEGLLWVDFEGTKPADDEPLLREVFHFHPLAIDDALAESHIPKLDDWGTYLYIVIHSVTFDSSDGGHIDTQELDIFLGERYMVTHHDEKIPSIERTMALLHRDPRHILHGMDHVLYRLVDDVVASYMPVVEALDDEIDKAEDQVFDRPTNSTLEKIFALKRAALHLRRIIGPQREVLNKLARDDFEVIDSRDRVYFRDVYDHLVRLQDITESIRDLIGGTLDTYLSVINNRMNDIMKTLTVITTLFMPISFIASFFGMNFFQPVANLSGWTSYPSFMITMALVVGIPFSMFLWVRRRGWM